MKISYEEGYWYHVNGGYTRSLDIAQEHSKATGESIDSLGYGRMKMRHDDPENYAEEFKHLASEPTPIGFESLPEPHKCR